VDSSNLLGIVVDMDLLSIHAYTDRRTLPRGSAAKNGSDGRRRNGLAERDRLVLLTLVQTGLRRAELIALDWADLDLESARPSLLVRHGKGGKPRRQSLAPTLAGELDLLRATRKAPAEAPVFCGLEGSRLQPTILAAIIHRAAKRAKLEKRVTAHTLRHTAATWLRQQTGDARLVAAYLGHADLSTVSRYAHVADDELHEAAAALAARVEGGERRELRHARVTPSRSSARRISGSSASIEVASVATRGV
jgi:integrase